MYEEFYGFVQSPFTLAPDPRFFYLSHSHEEAIRLLLQSIRRKEGFIVLTGDIGTGKTTLCRALLEQLDMTTFTSLLLNPFLSVEELLREILLDFGVVSRDAVRTGRIASATKHELASTLHDFLLTLVPIHGSGVLIIDEAQHLSGPVLEEIRVLSNLETNDRKLLQIVLVGQLNLLDILAEADMRQLDQRISLRATLSPLSRAEAEAYVAHRLAVAKGSSAVTFLTPAIDLIHAISGGVPRVINLLCDRALMVGAEARGVEITPAHVREAAGRLSLHAPPEAAPGLKRVPVWVWILLVLALAVAAAARFVPLDGFLASAPPAAPAAPDLTAAPALQPIPAETAEATAATAAP